MKEVIGNATLYLGDAWEVLRTLEDESIHCCVTSPPYYALRDYGVAGQMGLEDTVQEYLEKMIEVFAEVYRVLRSDGTCWINMGDSYSSGGNGGGLVAHVRSRENDGKVYKFHEDKSRTGDMNGLRRRTPEGMRPKNLMGMPWRLAFALQDFGWNLRQDIIWQKPSPMPESVRDRCTKAHEYIFLLSKSQKYYYDHEAIMEPVTGNAHSRGRGDNPKAVTGWDNGPGNHSTIEHNKPKHQTRPKQNSSFSTAVKSSGNLNRKQRPLSPEMHTGNQAGSIPWEGTHRNKRSVWTVPSKAYTEAHFATYPPALIEPCVLAGCPEGGTVLDPFAGSGTTGEVAVQMGRKAILIELNPEYIEMMRRRVFDAQRQARLFA